MSDKLVKNMQEACKVLFMHTTPADLYWYDIDCSCQVVNPKSTIRTNLLERTYLNYRHWID